MYEYQERLAERFDALRASRSTPVYFIEHGLTSPEVDDLHRLVRRNLDKQPIGDPYWDKHPLPLLIVATEVGYRYRGNGTDFWPLLEEVVGNRLPGVLRQRYRDLFRTGSARHGGVEPKSSSWTEAFHLIAWPIAHALLPVEFHRALASTLRKLRGSVYDMDDDTLYDAVKRANRHPSARFETWLSDGSLVVAVVRHLMAVRESEFSPAILARIAADLERDEQARRDLSIAKHVQRVQRSPRPGETADPVQFRGQFQVRRFEGGLSLEARLPLLDGAILEPLRRELLRRRYAPRLWGVSTRVPSEQLLSGVPFPITLSALPEVGAPLLPDLAELEISEEHRRILSALRLDLRAPLLFVLSSDGRLARQVRGTELTDRRTYWLLTPPEAASQLGKFALPGAVGPLACVEFESADPAAVKALADLGFRVRHGVSLRLAGALPLEPDADVPRFRVGDSLYVVPDRPPPEGCILSLDGEAVALSETPVKLRVEAGEHTLKLSAAGAARLYRYRGESKATGGRPRICWIELLAPDRSVESLLSRKLALRIDAVVPLEGLELTLELEAAGKQLCVSTPLGPLPQTLSGDSEIWEKLLDDPARSLLLRELNPQLRARIGSLAYSSFPLERRVRPCWWQHTDAEPVLLSELGAVPFGIVSSSRPTAPPAASIETRVQETVLLAPLPLDQSVYGAAAPFSTLCVAPERISLAPPTVSKPDLRRRRTAVHEDEIGLEEVVESYLRWAAAESASGTAEFRRKQVTRTLDRWVCEICCGPEWAHLENAGPLRSSPWQLLAEGLQQSVFGEVETRTEDEFSPGDVAADEIRRALPQLWSVVGPAGELEGPERETLELAYRRALERIAHVGTHDTGPYPDEWLARVECSTAWSRLLVQARSSAELHNLAELLLPTSSVNHLLRLDYTLLAFNDLADEFSRWCTEARTALTVDVPDRKSQETILMLWLLPEQVVHFDWRGVLDILLVDRCIARAARYMCLRSGSAVSAGRLN